MKQFFAVLESLITIVLVVAGLAGITYRTFREGGWISLGLSKMADAYLSYPLIAVAASVAVFFAFRIWSERRSLGHRGIAFDYLVYVFMAAGIYFIGYFIVTGKY